MIPVMMRLVVVFLPLSLVIPSKPSRSSAAAERASRRARFTASFMSLQGLSKQCFSISRLRAGSERRFLILSSLSDVPKQTRDLILYYSLGD